MQENYLGSIFTGFYKDIYEQKITNPLYEDQGVCQTRNHIRQCVLNRRIRVYFNVNGLPM